MSGGRGTGRKGRKGVEERVGMSEWRVREERCGEKERW